MGKLIYETTIPTHQILLKPFQEILDKRIILLYSILPKGSERSEVIETQTDGLINRYQIIFEHPFFEDGSKVEMDLVRIAWKEPGAGGIERVYEDSILIGVRYFNPDGSKRFPLSC
jgi:hypothetical protein